MPAPLETAISSQAATAVVLAGFAFVGFIFLLNVFATSTRPLFGTSVVGERVRIDPRRHEGRALFILAAAFSMGINAAFLYSTSAGLESSVAGRGFVVAQAAFAIEVVALIAALVVLIDMYLLSPGPIYSWVMGVLLTGYVLVRVIAELGRAWSAQEDTGTVGDNVWLAVVAVMPAAVFLAVAVLGRSAWLGSSFLESTRDFVSRSGIGYAAMIAVTGLFLAFTHLFISFRTSIDKLDWWVLALLALVVGVAAAWTAVQSWPEEHAWKSATTND
jgi:hypothetical protein